MKVVGFGDYMIHFSPVMDERFMQARMMQMSFTGAEANVCAALGLWGEKTELVTRLPDHELAQSGISFLKGVSVGTEHIVFGAGRMGTYYLEKGSGVRPSVVIYDRVPSAFTESVYEDYDWDTALQDAQVLYVTGITPALSGSLMDCTERIFRQAHAKGIRIFFDLNFRPKLLSPEKARENFSRLCPYISYLIGNEEHCKLLLGVESQYGEAEPALRLQEMTGKVRAVTGIPHVAVTVRRTPSASSAVFCAGYSDGNDFAMSPRYHLQVVDRVGSGDAFSAGFLYSVIHGKSVADTVCFAAAACAMKHAIVSDINFSTVKEIEALKENMGFDVRR